MSELSARVAQFAARQLADAVDYGKLAILESRDIFLRACEMAVDAGREDLVADTLRLYGLIAIQMFEDVVASGD